jgi:thioredoxin 1
MASRLYLLAALGALVLFGCSRTDTKQHSVFSGLDFEAARAEAQASGRIFLVDATATWCVPCGRMDETTWRDDDVRAWIDEHAVALQIDVDRQPERAKALHIEGMPTLIVFKGDDEFDRVVGYQDADQLLGWLDGVLEGRRAIDALRQAAGDRAGPEGTVDVQARLRLAEALAESGDAGAAAEEFVWLWDHMLEHRPSMYGVRLSFMAGDMARLAARSEEAKAMFIALRDRYQPAIDDGSADAEHVNDWVNLNQVVDDEQKTLDWYDRVKGDPQARELAAPVARDVFGLLVRRQRFADAGRVYPDPSGVAQRMVRMNERMAAYDRTESGMPQAQQAQMKEYREQRFRSELAELYATCLAAGRTDAAEQVADALLEAMDDGLSRQTLVKAALWVGQPQARHRAWLDEAASRGADDAALRERLEAALAAQR